MGKQSGCQTTCYRSDWPGGAGSQAAGQPTGVPTLNKSARIFKERGGLYIIVYLGVFTLIELVMSFLFYQQYHPPIRSTNHDEWANDKRKNRWVRAAGNPK